MNWLDILILVSLVAAALGGVFTGIIRGATSLAGLLLGIMLAGKYYGTAASWFHFITNENIANVAGFVVILALTIVVAHIIGTILRAAIKMAMLGWLDRLLGGILGFLIAVFAWSTLLALWLKFFGGNLVAESAFASLLLDKLPLVLGLLPEQFDTVRNFFGQ